MRCLRLTGLCRLAISAVLIAITAPALSQPADSTPPESAPAQPAPGADDAPASDLPPPPPPAPLVNAPPPNLGPGARQAWDAGRLLDEGQLSGAEAKAASAITTSDGKAAGYTVVARIRVRQGRLLDALAQLELAASADAAYSPARLLQVRVLEALGRGREAPGVIEPVLQKNKDSLGLRIALAEAWLAAGRPTDAMDEARAALKRSETSVTAMKLLARAYLSTGNDAAGEAILGRAMEIEKDAETYMLRGRVALLRNEIVEARAWFEKAAETDGQNVEVLTNLGWAYLKVRNFTAARDVLTKAVQLAPAYAAAWLDLGSAHRGDKDFGEAERSWKKTLELDPKMADAWFDLGVLYLENPLEGRDRESQLRDAIEAFNKYKLGRPPTSDDMAEVDKYIGEAKVLIEQEVQRKEEALKQPAPEPEPAPAPEGTDDEGSGDEGSGDEGTPDEGTGGDESGGDESGGEGTP
ncbi:MAG: tetratricopeptide repeat protein [Myxococcota bacterium]